MKAEKRNKEQITKTTKNSPQMTYNKIIGKNMIKY